MTDIKLGMMAELNFVVDEQMGINRTGRPGGEVLSTPSLLYLMEKCSIEAVDPHLPAKSVTVGYAVDGLRHLAPTRVGGKVHVRAEVIEVDGKKITLKIGAFEGEKEIGVAVHKRAVISTE